MSGFGVKWCFTFMTLIRCPCRRCGPGLEEEEEELFVFNDTAEGPRTPAVKPGRVTQA